VHHPYDDLALFTRSQICQGHYPAELRRLICDRILAGDAVKDLVAELGISEDTLYRWRHQGIIDARQPGGQELRGRPDSALGKTTFPQVKSAW
jgi:transposase-like protein